MLSQLVVIFYFILLSSLSNCYDDWVYKTVRDAEARNENIDDCGICKLLTESFKRAFDQTDNLMQPNYENSELRLVEIQEILCTDLQHGRNKCLKLAQEKEEEIEHWWYNKKEENLFQYLCIRKFKICCVAGHYGPNCKKCPGAPDNICNKNGKCNGEGTRKGDGTCICNEGSEGIECDTCKSNFIMLETGVCSPCDKACKNGCTKLGKEGCIDGCATGFKEDENGVCQDIDECKENPKICPDGSICQNVYGSHHCVGCDKVCKTCYGLGNQCIECANGYVKEGLKCIPYNESKQSNTAEVFKYLVYVSITSFSCYLMAKKLKLVALLITILFCIYVGLTEYANLNSLDGTLDAFEELYL